MCLGTGAEWAPCGIVQVGGCHSGDVLEGGAAGVTLPMGCLAISCAPPRKA